MTLYNMNPLGYFYTGILIALILGISYFVLRRATNLQSTPGLLFFVVVGDFEYLLKDSEVVGGIQNSPQISTKIV